MKTEYEKWKLVAWRFGRVFLSAFIIELAVVLPTIQTYDVQSLYRLLLIPCLIAGLSALGKALREYTDKFSKLPL